MCLKEIAKVSKDGRANPADSPHERVSDYYYYYYYYYYSILRRY